MIKYGDGKAGQFSKSHAQRKAHHILRQLAVVGAIGGLLAGIPMGYGLSFALARSRNLLSVPTWVYLVTLAALELVVGALILFLIPAMDPYQDRLSRERIWHLRGGTAEALVAWHLGHLDDQWHLFNNVEMKGGGDIDHVLVGPGGLFTISVKSVKGIYRLERDGRVLLNGIPTDHISDAQNGAYRVRHWVEAWSQKIDEVKKIPFVQPVLVAPFARIDFPHDSMKVMVFDEREFLDFVCRCKETLGKSQVEAYARILAELSGKAKKPIGSDTTPAMRTSA